MTREEQLDWLCRLRSAVKIYMPIEWVEHFEDALTESIKALSQEPCDDVVSRDEVLKIIDKWYENKSDIEDLIILITYMSSVTQKSKTGHWKRISMDKYTTHAQYWYECDKCGEHNLGNTDYCPSCGAKMVEPQESEDKE